MARPPRCLALLLVLLVISLGPLARADSANARVLVSEGNALAESGQREEALLAFEQAIRSDATYIPAYEAALPLWLALGHFEEARKQLEELTVRCVDCSFAWYALGALYRKASRFDLAALAYDAYLARRPKDADAHFGLAMAFAASKDPRAREQLVRYLALETRSERDVYRARALLLLRELGGADTSYRSQLARGAADSIPRMAELVKARRLASAESVLLATGRTDAEAMYWRVEIAEGRGQWFQALGYRTLLRLYSLGL